MIAIILETIHKLISKFLKIPCRKSFNLVDIALCKNRSNHLFKSSWLTNRYRYSKLFVLGPRYKQYKGRRKIIIKIVKPLKDPYIVIKCVTKTMKGKNKQSGFLDYYFVF